MIPEEIKVIETPVEKKKVKVKAFLRGKDFREYRHFLLQLNEDGKGGTPEGMDLAENHMIESVVIEFDGSKEEIVDKVLALHQKDYEFIVNTVRKIITGADEDGEESEDQKKSEVT